jgi:hypothetical protein
MDGYFSLPFIGLTTYISRAISSGNLKRLKEFVKGVGGDFPILFLIKVG